MDHFLLLFSTKPECSVTCQKMHEIHWNTLKYIHAKLSLSNMHTNILYSTHERRIHSLKKINKFRVSIGLLSFSSARVQKDKSQCRWYQLYWVFLRTERVSFGKESYRISVMSRVGVNIAFSRTKHPFLGEFLTIPDNHSIQRVDVDINKCYILNFTLSGVDWSANRGI